MRVDVCSPAACLIRQAEAHNQVCPRPRHVQARRQEVLALGSKPLLEERTSSTEGQPQAPKQDSPAAAKPEPLAPGDPAGSLEQAGTLGQPAAPDEQQGPEQSLTPQLPRAAAAEGRTRAADADANSPPSVPAPRLQEQASDGQPGAGSATPAPAAASAAAEALGPAAQLGALQQAEPPVTPAESLAASAASRGHTATAAPANARGTEDPGSAAAPKAQQVEQEASAQPRLGDTGEAAVLARLEAAPQPSGATPEVPAPAPSPAGSKPAPSSAPTLHSNGVCPPKGDEGPPEVGKGAPARRESGPEQPPEEGGKTLVQRLMGFARGATRGPEKQSARKPACKPHAVRGMLSAAWLCGLSMCSAGCLRALLHDGLQVPPPCRG